MGRAASSNTTACVANRKTGEAMPMAARAPDERDGLVTAYGGIPHTIINNNNKVREKPRK